MCSRYCAELYTTWTESVSESSQYNLGLPLIIRDSVTRLISVNFNQEVYLVFWICMLENLTCCKGFGMSIWLSLFVQKYYANFLEIRHIIEYSFNFRGFFCTMQFFFTPLASLHLYWEKWSTCNSDGLRRSLSLRCRSTPPEGSCGSMWPTWRWLWADITRL